MFGNKNGPMASHDFKSIAKDLDFADRINNCIDNILPSQQNLVVKAMRYSLLVGGKRLRPLMVNEVCKAIIADANIEEDSIVVGSALEMIHTYSLIHDDLPCIDDDDFRRGQPSCHKAFDEATAILAGDALVPLAFNVISTYAFKSEITDAQKCKMIGAISKIIGHSSLIFGQILDIHTENEITTDYIKRVHLLKTASMFELACTLGCVVANCTDEQMIQKFEMYGIYFGFLFQTVDDFLDQENEEDKCNMARHLGADKTMTLINEYYENAVNAVYDVDKNGTLRALAKKVMSYIAK